MSDKWKSGPELESASSQAGRILLVDSDPKVARAMEAKLLAEGHEVVVAFSGKGALDASRSDHFDVAVVDRSLPDIPGTRVMATLRNADAQLEVVMSTSDDAPEVELELLEQGAFAVLRKPLTHPRLLTLRVAQAVEKVHLAADRAELARTLHAQTAALATREVEAELYGPDEPSANINLDQMAGSDPLTGLPNAKAADERFRKEAARALRYDRPLTIALASIDNFETVRERFGDEVSDGVLRGIAAMFAGIVRDVDYVARLEGGHFFFIFPETPKEHGAVAVGRMRQKLLGTSFSDYFGEGPAQVRLTISFGIAGLPADTMNGDLLRNAAESALQRAKMLGDRIVFFDASMTRRA